MPQHAELPVSLRLLKRGYAPSSKGPRRRDACARMTAERRGAESAACGKPDSGKTGLEENQTRAKTGSRETKHAGNCGDAELREQRASQWALRRKAAK